MWVTGQRLRAGGLAGLLHPHGLPGNVSAGWCERTDGIADTVVPTGLTFDTDQVVVEPKRYLRDKDTPAHCSLAVKTPR